MNSIDPKSVADAHNAMSEEYDLIDDLWYTFLFNQIHGFIIQYLPSTPGGKALDVGCGTGFQSFLLSKAGYQVSGFDISNKLIEIAQDKVRNLEESLTYLFKSELKECMAMQTEILNRAERLRGKSPIIPPDFRIGDATEKCHYPTESYDVNICCGSVLSLIDKHERVMALMHSSLKKGGLLFLEVEQKVNPDLLWPIVDTMMLGRLGYDMTIKEAISNVFAPPGRNIRIDYPFELGNGEEVVLPLWIFSISYLERMFRRNGFKIMGKVGVHSITNIIPSTLLHKKPTNRLRFVFDILSRVELPLARRWPFWRFGCSVVYCLEKR